jgi:hypothetical protein
MSRDADAPEPDAWTDRMEVSWAKQYGFGEFYPDTDLTLGDPIPVYFGTPPASRVPEGDALEELAQKAAWMLEHGATNENADLCRGVIALARLRQEGGGV